MQVNFELYKVFYYVATHESFSHAAKQLYISQSAVSQSIKLLEEKLETSLFIRNTKKVILTNEGVILLKHIEPAINLIKNGEKNITELHSLKKGHIHIGASDTICKYYLLHYFKIFHQLYPQINLQITNRTSTQCVELLNQGQVDFIVTNYPNNQISNNMNIIKTNSFNDVFIAGSDYFHLKDKTLSLSSLNNYPVLMLEKNTTTRTFFENIINKYEISIIPEVELGSIDLLIEMAKINLGISFVPNYCIDDTMKDLFILKLRENIPNRSLAIVTHNNIPLSLASKEFIHTLTSIHG